MHRISRSGIGLALLAALAAGCAQTPQTVRLVPEPADDYAIDYGEGRPVAFRVIDERPNKDRIGVLKNRDAEDADLKMKQDLDYVVEVAAGSTLKAYGFQPTGWDADAERRLTLRIQGLDHTVGSAVPRSVTTQVRLSGKAVVRDDTFSLNAEHRSTDQITHRPSPDENAAYVEKTITKALGRVFTDDLAKFLVDGASED